LRAGLRHSLSMLHLTMADKQLERLRDVKQPTLVAAGEHDPIVPPRWVHEMAKRMPNACARILAGCPHAMTYSRPHALAGAIDAVIQEWIHET
ncbi:MAG TPA: alpha/beta hydrolase, partial [Thermomicrobiales bacterium]|nr:alpha/beta hydrolase [Thermomicrobiales bacterium]